jgi:hypothetical protein
LILLSSGLPKLLTTFKFDQASIKQQPQGAVVVKTAREKKYINHGSQNRAERNS